MLKLVATIVSYASGNAGGIFAPSLYIGAMAGGAVGMVVHRVAPFPTGDPGAYALVGMGTLFAGIIRAPMTSVFMIFEITQDYQILVPLMVANLLSFVISRRYQPMPVYHALLQQDDVHLPSPAARARRLAADGAPPHAGGGAVPGRRPAGRASLADARRSARPRPPRGDAPAPGRLRDAHSSRSDGWRRGSPPKPWAPWLTALLVQVYPDHPLDVVLDRFAQTGGLLPVMSRTVVGRVEGVVTLDSILSVVDRRSRRREPAVAATPDAHGAGSRG